MIHLIHCKNFGKCYNVLPPNIAIKKKKKAFVGGGRQKLFYLKKKKEGSIDQRWYMPLILVT
jgi:hypothetical protein